MQFTPKFELASSGESDLLTMSPNASDIGKKREKQDVDSWAYWEAESLSDALEIESHFINGGMKGGTDGILSPSKPIYVYIF